METGSTATAFATTHSLTNRRFPVSDEYAPIWGLFRRPNEPRAVSAAPRDCDSGDFGPRSLGSPNPFLAPA
jgi:hypothetical protein